MSIVSGSAVWTPYLTLFTQSLTAIRNKCTRYCRKLGMPELSPADLFFLYCLGTFCPVWQLKNRTSVCGHLFTGDTQKPDQCRSCAVSLDFANPPDKAQTSRLGIRRRQRASHCQTRLSHQKHRRVSSNCKPIDSPQCPCVGHIHRTRCSMGVDGGKSISKLHFV